MPHRLSACALALLLAGPLAGIPLTTAQQTEVQQTREYDIPAGPLGQVLSRFAAEAGILLSGDAALTAGQSSPGLQGRYSVQEGLSRLLAGTGLSHRFIDADTVTLEPQPTADETGALQLAPITVEGWRTSTTAGYRAEGISSATKTDALLVDVPASVSVVTEQVIDDQRATSVAEALRNVPGVGIGPNPANVSVQEEATVRGFESALVRVNRVQRRSTGPLSLANVASVEVLKGPFSVLYGDLSPGGFVNIQTKRPQAESAAAASVGGAQVAGNRGTTDRASVDLTGPMNEAGSVLYRFIVSAEGGSSFIDTVDNERYFIAPSLSYLGLDGRLRIDLDLSYLRNDESFLFGIPSRNDRPDTRIGHDRFPGAADGSKLTEDYTAELRAEYALDERTQVDAALTYHLNEHDSRALRPFGSPGQGVAEDDTVRRSYSLRVFETDDLQFETNVVHEIFTDTTEWRFLAGGDVRRTTVAHAGPGFGNIVDFDRVDVLDPDNAAALPALDDPRIRSGCEPTGGATPRGSWN